MGKEKVAYFYDAEIGNYHYGPGNMFMYCTLYSVLYSVHGTPRLDCSVFNNLN